jgi:hypothetical protein
VRLLLFDLEHVHDFGRGEGEAAGARTSLEVVVTEEVVVMEEAAAAAVVVVVVAAAVVVVAATIPETQASSTETDPAAALALQSHPQTKPLLPLQNINKGNLFSRLHIESKERVTRGHVARNAKRTSLSSKAAPSTHAINLPP